MLELLHYIAVAVIVGFLIYFICLDRKYKIANPHYSSLLITIGIGFTFFGVALGLMDFNTEDPTASLATLVNGIKTAFWGSLTGVVASIILKFHALIALKETDADLKSNEQIQKFYQEHTGLFNNSQILQQIYQTLNVNNQNLIDCISQFGLDLDKNNKSNMQEMLQSIGTSLSGIEQIQRSTQGYIAGEISELRSEFVNFAQKQSEQNTEIFIQALETAIQRFNDNLTDSLGENFKQLNQSVYRLVDWQNNYSIQVEDQTQKYAVISEHIDQIKNNFSDILRNTDMFNLAIHQMETAIGSIDHKNEEFNKRIESFYGGLDSKIIDIENTRQILDQGFQKIESQMNSTQQLTQNVFADINSFLTQSHSNALNSQKQSADHVQHMNMQLKNVMEQSQHQLSESLGTLENKLQQTLNQSLITLAQQLGSLSTKFAQDYEPITVNLKRVMDSMDKGIQ